jgi:hypothetical protein
MQQATLTPKKFRFRKERSFSEKLDATFAFLSENIRPLGKNILLIAGPFALLAGICYGIYQSYTFGAAMGRVMENLESSSNMALLGAGVLGMVFFSLMATTMVIAITMHYVRQYINDGPVHHSTAYLWKKIWKEFFSVLGTSIMLFLSMVVLIFILALPVGLVSAASPNPVILGIMMFFVMIAFFLILPAFLLLYPIRSIEKVGVFTAIDRMFRLISGKWLSTSGLVIVTTIIQGVIAMVFAIPMYIFLFLQFMHQTEENVSLPSPGSAIGDIILALTSGFSMLGSFALYSLVMIAVSFQYFNLVERREATGLLERIDRFGEKKTDQEDEEEHY